jgi:hypothetical protein
MNCPHRGIRFDGTCAYCGDRVSPPPPGVIAAELARCDHQANTARWSLVRVDSLEWCAHCGARRTIDANGARRWVLPKWVKQAKALDATGALAGVTSNGPLLDSHEKNVK